MKQMRSRFRLLTLLLVCGFLVTAALCTGSALREAGITLPRLPVLSPAGETPVPDSGSDGMTAESSSPDPVSGEIPGESASPLPDASVPADQSAPGTDILPDLEYNTFGL